MHTANPFSRYIWLIDLLLRERKLTLKEIQEKWENATLNDFQQKFPRKTFSEHCDKIAEIFDIDIVYKNKGYSIENEEKIIKNKVHNWVLNSFTVKDLLEERKYLMDRILLEDIPSGREFLGILLDAMQENRVTSLFYQSFEKNTPERFYFAPYCIKLFKQRWYVVGLRQDLNQIRIYSLDRIKNIELNKITFTLPADFDSETYFKHSFGIFADHSISEKTIRLKAYDHKQQYLKALPIHHSQKEVGTGTNFTIFEVCVRPTYDFRQFLLSHGDEIEVISPVDFRQEMKEVITKMNNFYK